MRIKCLRGSLLTVRWVLQWLILAIVCISAVMGDTGCDHGVYCSIIPHFQALARARGGINLGDAYTPEECAINMNNSSRSRIDPARDLDVCVVSNYTGVWPSGDVVYEFLHSVMFVDTLIGYNQDTPNGTNITFLAPNGNISLFNTRLIGPR